MEAINREVRPDCVVHTGDMVNWGSERAALEAGRDLMRGLSCPWLPVLGNHDGRPEVFAEIFRPRTYGVDINGVHFSVLGTFQGHVEPEHLAWLRADLEGHRGVPVILVTHHPLYLQGGGYRLVLGNAAEVLDILSRYPNVLLLLSGHDHVFSARAHDGRLCVIGPSMVESPCAFLTVDLYPDRIRVVPYCLADPKGFLDGDAPGNYVPSEQDAMEVRIQREPTLRVLPPVAPEPFRGTASDDFQSGSLADWDAQPPALWEVATDGDNRALHLRTPPADGAPVLMGMKGAALLREKALRDFEWTCRVRLDTGKAHEDLALLFNHVSSGEFQYVLFKNTPLDSKFLKSGVYEAGSVAPLAGPMLPLLADGEFHRIRLLKRGDALTVWVDGEKKIEAKHPSLEGCGNVGFASWNDAAWFDDVEIRSL